MTVTRIGPSATRSRSASIRLRPATVSFATTSTCRGRAAAAAGRAGSSYGFSLIGQSLVDERVEGVWGNREVPPQRRRRGLVGETWFPPRERAEGERRSRRVDRLRGLGRPARLDGPPVHDGMPGATHAVLVRAADDLRDRVEVEDGRRRGDLPLERHRAPRVPRRERSAPPAHEHVVEEDERRGTEGEGGDRDDQVPVAE